MNPGERLRQLNELLPRVEAHATRTEQKAVEAARMLDALNAAIADEQGRGRHLHAVA